MLGRWSLSELLKINGLQGDQIWKIGYKILADEACQGAKLIQFKAQKIKEYKSPVLFIHLVTLVVAKAFEIKAESPLDSHAYRWESGLHSSLEAVLAETSTGRVLAMHIKSVYYFYYFYYPACSPLVWLEKFLGPQSCI